MILLILVFRQYDNTNCLRNKTLFYKEIKLAYMPSIGMCIKLEEELLQIGDITQTLNGDLNLYSYKNISKYENFGNAMACMSKTLLEDGWKPYLGPNEG